MSPNNSNLLNLTLILFLISVLISACGGDSPETELAEPSAVSTRIRSEAVSGKEYLKGNEELETATPDFNSQGPLFAPAPTPNPGQGAVAVLPPGRRLGDE